MKHGTAFDRMHHWLSTSVCGHGRAIVRENDPGLPACLHACMMMHLHAQDNNLARDYLRNLNKHMEKKEKKKRGGKKTTKQAWSGRGNAAPIVTGA